MMKITFEDSVSGTLKLRPETRSDDFTEEVYPGDHKSTANVELIKQQGTSCTGPHNASRLLHKTPVRDLIVDFMSYERTHALIRPTFVKRIKSLVATFNFERAKWMDIHVRRGSEISG